MFWDRAHRKRPRVASQTADTVPETMQRQTQNGKVQQVGTRMSKVRQRDPIHGYKNDFESLQSIHKVLK